MGSIPPHPKVKNRSGLDIGRIEEVIACRDTGVPAYALVRMGAFLGSTPRMFGVPVQVLRFDDGTGAYELDVEPEVMRRLPKFDETVRNELDQRYFDDVSALVGA